MPRKILLGVSEWNLLYLELKASFCDYFVPSADAPYKMELNSKSLDRIDYKDLTFSGVKVQICHIEVM